MFHVKRKVIEISAFSAGEVKPLSAVDDEVFSKELMGEGFAIFPNGNGQILAPFDAEIISVFSTKHALSLKSNNIEVLLHFGLDTVELEGKPFEILVSQGEKVSKKAPLMNIDLEAIRDSGKSDALIFVIPDKNQFKELSVEWINCEPGQIIGKLKQK